MSTRFMLVRHATCARTASVLLGRGVDAPLDAQGERQARAVATQLAAFAPLVVWSSPRRRARQTAEAIAAAAACPLRESRDIDEVDFGDWCGCSFDELDVLPEWRRWNADREHARTPAGDSVTKVRARALRLMDVIARGEGADATVVLVTHAEVIRTVLLHALQRPPGDFLHFDLPPASVTRIDLCGSHWSVRPLDERVAA